MVAKKNTHVVCISLCFTRNFYLPYKIKKTPLKLNDPFN